MDSEASSADTTDQTGTVPSAQTNRDPATEPVKPAAAGATAQPDIMTLLIDMVAAVVMKQINPLLEDFHKIKEAGIPLPVTPEKPQVLELPEVNMDLMPGRVTLPGNAGAAEPEIPRILIDTVVAVVLKEFAPLLEDLHKIRDQGIAGVGSPPTGQSGQRLVSDLLGQGTADGPVEAKTLVASIKAREDQMRFRMHKIHERSEALKTAARKKRGS